MEGAWVHFNLSWRRCQFRQRSDRAFAYHSHRILRPATEVRILGMAPTVGPNLSEIFVGPPVMYGAVRPFLEALKTGSTGIPFSKYLVLRGDIWQISRLIHGMRPLRAFCETSASPPGGHGLRFDAKDAASIANVGEILRNDSTLDPSQAEALVDSLTGEISLVQGHLAHSRFVFLTPFRLASSLWVFPELYRNVSSPSSDQELNQSYNHDCLRHSRPRPPAWQCPGCRYHE